ncbi:MAG TPA: phosphotransferase [Pyrinomonadaceae bacterium]|nr:phosphotransferase [Pyrinomonadaceae bacterium]
MKALGNKSESSQVYLALVHHANQYVITNGYADRQGMNDILGLSNPLWGPGVHRTGFLPLLQMHLDYQIPLNLHLSGTLMETLVWHYPESFSVIKRLLKEGLLELVGSTFSQNVMPFFSPDYNIRQINEELWMYREHLGVDLKDIQNFWVPERVWNTQKLAGILTNKELLNGGYKRVLLDDRLIYPGGSDYRGSERERFDQERRLEKEALAAWEISDGCGLVMLPISRQLRYSIPPSDHESWQRMYELLGWLATSGDEHTIAVYGDDLERAAGVGGWEISHSERYEQFLKWLADNRWVKPVLINDWAADHQPAGVRDIEEGTFYELAQTWNAGENYRGWYEDPNCQEHRAYLIKAEQELVAAEQRGAEKSLLELGWKHLLHSSYETSWHNRADETPNYQPAAYGGRSMWLAPWAAALTSHARACLVIAQAANWFVARDGSAHAELIDIDDDGEVELVLKNDQLFAVFAPRLGGRLVYLFDLSDEAGRLVIGNLSDDWNLQEELNRYMDCPRNHPGALADVGYEHNRYQGIISEANGPAVSVRLLNVEPGSPLNSLEKQICLDAESSYLSITYAVPRELWRVSTEICLSPDYHRMLRYGKKGLALFNGPTWKGWSNGSVRAWVRIDSEESTIWDKPYQSECGHGLNLRVTSFSKEFHLQLGIGTPPQHSQESKKGAKALIESHVTAEAFRAPRQPMIISNTAVRQATPTNGNGLHEHGANGNGRGKSLVRSKEHTDQILHVTNPHFMRRFMGYNLPAMQLQWFEVAACRVRMLKPHHDKLTIEYNLQCRNGKKGNVFVHDLVGTWRQDARNSDMNNLYKRLWDDGFSNQSQLNIPQPLGYWGRLHLRLREKASGKLLKDWINYTDADWTGPMRRVGSWLAKLHSSNIKVAREFNVETETRLLKGWMEDLMACDFSWIVSEKERIREVMEELIARTSDMELINVCLTHGDFHPENIFVRGNSITVIDFEQSAIADPASDLGYLLGEIDVQSDRYWHRRGRLSPLDLERTAEALLDEYFNKRPSQALEMIPLHCARTYLKHLVHTVRMKGTEDPKSVTLWLDKAEACLKEFRPALSRSLRLTHPSASFPTVG